MPWRWHTKCCLCFQCIQDFDVLSVFRICNQERCHNKCAKDGWASGRADRARLGRRSRNTKTIITLEADAHQIVAIMEAGWEILRSRALFNNYEGHIKSTRQSLQCSFRAFRWDACDA